MFGKIVRHIGKFQLIFDLGPGEFLIPARSFYFSGGTGVRGLGIAVVQKCWLFFEYSLILLPLHDNY